MRKFLIISALLLMSTTLFQQSDAAGFSGYGCGTLCMAQMRSYCPSCGPMTGYYNYNSLPWGAPRPMWWQTGPMMYSNFYSPAPWMYGPMPGIMPGYYPGSGHIGAAKPNLYLQGKPGTAVTVKVNFLEKGANWLMSVPSHGKRGWKGVLQENNRIQTDQGTYAWLFSDYRVNGLNFQDQAGFCAPREEVIGKMASALHQAGFAPREIADFAEYWSVKLPTSKKFCVYPQDERQLDQVAALEITPKPVAVRRVLFVMQVEEGLSSSGEKFTAVPKASWVPQANRLPAAATEGLVAREWGVAFFFAPKR